MKKDAQASSKAVLASATFLVRRSSLIVFELPPSSCSVRLRHLPTCHPLRSMRPVHQSEIKVGLLVLAGLAATIAMVMSADKFHFESTYRVTAYLKDAGGLRFESPVTLSGIAVGKVKAIEFVTPDEHQPGQVRATITIAQGVILPADVEAHLATSGLFGDSSLALAAPLKRSTTPAQLPTDGSGVLMVQAGMMDQAIDKAGGILTAVEDLLDAPTRSDAKRLVHSAADLAEHAAGIAATLDAQQQRIATILGNLESITGDLKATTQTLNQKLEPILTKADATISRMDGLIDASTATMVRADDLLTDVDGVLAANAAPLNELLLSVASVSRKAETVLSVLTNGQGVLGQLLINRDLAQDLHHLTVDAEAAARLIADKPSRLVFDDANSERVRERTVRDREKMRRNLAEGFGQPVTRPVTQSTTSSVPETPVNH